MKQRLIIASVLCLLSYGYANGQSYFGFRAGLNATAVRFPSEVYQKYYSPGLKPGYTGGMVFFIEKKELFGLYSEIMYSAKGKFVESDANDYESNTARYHFIDVPILFRVKFTKKKTGYYVQFGPEFNYWLGGNGTFKVYEPDRDTFSNYDYKVNFGDPVFESNYLNATDVNRLQLGLCFSGGMTWKLKNANYLAVDVRYSMGHTYQGGYDSASIPNIGLVENFEYTNDVLSASLVYYFDILEKVRLSKNKY